jgi:hypothetical protein
MIPATLRPAAGLADGADMPKPAPGRDYPDFQNGQRFPNRMRFRVGSYVIENGDSMRWGYVGLTGCLFASVGRPGWSKANGGID